MANEREQEPIGRAFEDEVGEVRESVGTPTENVRQVITSDDQVRTELSDADDVIIRDDDGYVGPDGKMQPHQTPLEVGPSADVDLEFVDAAEREASETLREIWEVES